MHGDLSRYYDWLSRYQRLAAWIGKGGGYDALTVHRLVSLDDPGASTGQGVHERLLAALGPMSAPRVIDAGCGLGGTISFCIRGSVVDMTVDAQPGAVYAGGAGATRRGIAGDCRFHIRSYDDDLGDIAPDGADVIIAIESLAHAVRPSATIASLARALRGGARLIVIDDMPAAALAADEDDFAKFRRGWRCPAIASHDALVAALSAAGLSVERDEDWTSAVPIRDGRSLERLVRVNRLLRRLAGLTPAAVVLDALHGGLMLERLYRRGLMQLRLLSARRRQPLSA